MRAKRILLLEVLFIMGATTLVGRAVWLQLAAPARLERLANRQFKTRVTTLPSRGAILDREGQGLAISMKARSLYVRPEALRVTVRDRGALKRLARAVATVIHQPYEKVLEKLTSKKPFVWIKRPLADDEEKAVRTLGLERFGDGLALVEESRRAYPSRELAAHALGTVNIDGKGIEGLELYYDAVLAGEQSRISSMKDARGRSIFVDDHGILAFRHGQSLVLTIDRVIQFQAEKIIRQYAEDLGAKAAMAIVMDVETGEILALANTPSYDPNKPQSFSADARRNRTATDIMEPGSTLKPIITAFALEGGISPETQIYCERGKFKVADRWITEAETHERFEWMDLSHILARSSNIGAAKLALSLGADAVGNGLQRIGVGVKTGIDLPGEVSGAAEPWASFVKSLRSPVRLANVGFGHGITATPLQLLSWYSALATDGQVRTPFLVKRVLSDAGEVVHEFAPRPPKRVFTAVAARKVALMLEKVVTGDGTGTQAALADWTVAGKTGTAQKVDPRTKKYSRSKFISTFIGFAPAKAPKLVALVLFDEPTRHYYAGETAAPAFREVMQAALVRRNVPPDLSSPAALLSRNKQAVRSVLNAVSTVQPRGAALTRGMPEVGEEGRIRLPDLKGMTVREALRLVGTQPLTPEILGSGILKTQEPAAEEWLEPRQKVRLHFEP